MIPVTVELIQKHLQDTYKFNGDQVETMLGSLTKSLNLEFTNAEEALAQNDIIALSKASHTIKGALLNAGVADWSEIARTIELSAKAGQDLDYAGLINELKSGLNAIL
jgi:HPt (histidine-containing phosphotransfer) domain-containing protein